MKQIATLLTLLVLLVLTQSASAARGPAYSALETAAAGREALAFDGNTLPKTAVSGTPVLSWNASKPGVLQRHCGGFTGCYHESLKSYGPKKMQQGLAMAGALGGFFLLGKITAPGLYPLALIGGPIGLCIGLAVGTLIYGLFIAKGRKS